MERVLVWLLVGVGGAAALGFGVLLGFGLVVQRISWADTAVYAGIVTPFAAALLLWVLGWLTGTASTVNAGFGLLLGFAAYYLVVLLPLMLIVVRVRKKKGWFASLAGKPPVVR